jgi:hypothetical protein
MGLWKFSLSQAIFMQVSGKSEWKFLLPFRQKTRKSRAKISWLRAERETLPENEKASRNELSSSPSSNNNSTEASLQLELKSNEKFSGILNENVTSSAEERLSASPVSMVGERRKEASALPAPTF